MPNIILGGTTFEITEKGSGELVVFVHGSASDVRTWEHQIETLGNHFRAVAYSRRYHWPNDPIPDGADYSIREHVDDLAALARSLGGGPVHLVGHSYGALASLLLAVAEPARVRTLVLVEPPAITLFVSNMPKPQELARLLLARPRTALGIMRLGALGLGPATAAMRRGDKEEAMRRFGNAALGASAFDRLSDARKSQVLSNLIEAEFTGSGFPPLRSEDMRSIRAPTLLVHGESSPSVFRRLGERLQELLANAE